MESRSGGGLILLRRKTPLPRRSVVYFCAGAHTSSADIGDAECEIAVGTDVLCAELLTVRQSGLDQELGHEAERAGIDGTLGGNGLHDGQQGVWLPGGNGTFSRAKRVQPRG